MMRRIFHLTSAVIAGILLLSLPGCSGSAGQLRCNTATVDITPEGHVLLAGFAARVGLSTTVHRPLKSTCLVIERDTARLCIIVNDMMELSIGLADDLRREISAQTGIPAGNIFLHCTHTHSAPRVGGSSVEQGGSNAAFKKKFMENVVNNAVKTANDRKAFQPFTLETGKGSCDINCNRGEKNGPVDHDVYAVRLLDKKGKPIVSMVNYSCHPVSFGPRSLYVSPDFPGITREILEKKWGGNVIYLSGAQGNVDPCGSLKADTAYTQQRGQQLADAVSGIQFGKMKPDHTLTVNNAEVRLPFRIPEITAEAINAHVDEIMQWTVSGTWKDDVAGWRELILERIASGEVNNYLPFQIAAVRVGGLCLFFSQGEPFNEYQTVLRESMPGVPALFIAYTNGQNSYLPSARAYQVPAYEYEKEQMHIYIKAPYPLSPDMPVVYAEAMKQLTSNY
ncbi:MAG: hypothetical protein LBR08_10530 [Bacteroidales bacterium]|jgi:hypothetical protein|nr:hypothetical protein [Bacteroidales bacterium]